MCTAVRLWGLGLRLSVYRVLKRYAELGAVIVVFTVVVWVAADQYARSQPGTSASTEAKSYISWNITAVKAIITLLLVSTITILLVYAAKQLTRQTRQYY